MKIHEVPQGINVVVETEDLIYIGRFRQSEPGLVRLQDCAVHANIPNATTEKYVRHTAKYGVEISENDVVLQAGNIQRVRALKDIPKP